MLLYTVVAMITWIKGDILPVILLLISIFPSCLGLTKTLELYQFFL